MKKQNPELTLLQGFKNDLVRHSIAITVKRFVTDITGLVIDNALVPAALQLDYPFYMLGEFDRQGGYNIAQRVQPPPAGIDFLTSFVNGNPNTPESITGFSGTCNVRLLINRGDLVQVFTDDVQNPSYFIWIVLSSNGPALSAIVANSATSMKDDKFNRLWIEDINYSITNPSLNDSMEQWKQMIHKTRLNNIGVYLDDTFSAFMYLTPESYQTSIIRVPFSFKVDQYIGLNSVMLWGTQQIKLTLNLLK